MSETNKTETSVKPARNINRQNVTATAVAATVTVVLGIAANVLIGKIGTTVHDKIAPPKTAESE